MALTSPPAAPAAPSGLGIGSLKRTTPAFSAAPELDWPHGGTIARDIPLAQLRTPVPPPRARPSVTSSPGLILNITPAGPAVRIFRVARPAGFAFEAGQSVKLGLEGSSIRRRYSIASAPHEPHLEFCIESIPGGLLTSQLFELTPGAPLSLAPRAKGAFALRADRRQHVMVATVTGIAPLRSMLREALFGSSAATPEAAAPEFWLLHGASYQDELPYAGELAALASQNPRVHYTPTVSRPWAARNRGWSGRQGRVDALVLPTLQALGSKRDIAVYACGHPEMVRTVRESLEPLGYLVLDEAYD
jgi:ferredoxin-NADP reductase